MKERNQKTITEDDRGAVAAGGSTVVVCGGVASYTPDDHTKEAAKKN